MRFLQQIPLTLIIIFGVLLGAVFMLLLFAWVGGKEKSSYEFLKDVVIPMISPLVAIFIPTILFYLLPLRQNQLKATMDLFHIYNTEEMRQARNVAWEHFVTERRNFAQQTQDRVLDDFLRFLSEPDVNRSVSPELHEKYQKLSKVLDFFGVLNGCLQRKILSREMVLAFFGYYYLWWRDEVLLPLRSRPLLAHGQPRYLPSWWHDLKELDSLCLQKN